MKKALVTCSGFVGDILFASSLAKKIHEQFKGNVLVDYFIPLIQPLELLKRNPYINTVYTKDNWPATPAQYEFYFNTPLVDQSFPATWQFQKSVGIVNPSVEYEVYTVPEHDAEARAAVDKLHAEALWKPVVAYQRDWENKAYQCTVDTLRNGIGAPHRDIGSIIVALEPVFTLVPVGLDRGFTSSFAPEAQNAESYSKTASLIKACDFFIGSEGGLSNLAAGVGTKCLITTDFIWQNYGPNGRVKPCNPPQMGPAVYFPNAGHTHLPPILTDAQVASEITRIIGESYGK